LIQQEWRGEEYFLQIDAHTRFLKGWDEMVIKQLAMCPSAKPCLTQYPSDYKIAKAKKSKNSQKDEKWESHMLRGPILIENIDEKDGFTRIQSDYTTAKYTKPIPGRGWGACFSFSKATFILDAGYDPYTPFLFFGEELDITVRAWTRGWDFFSPYTSFMFTSFERDHRPTFWEHPHQRDCEILSRFRIYVRRGYVEAKYVPPMILIDMDNFLLGTVRTLAEYEKFARFSIKDEKLLTEINPRVF